MGRGQDYMTHLSFEVRNHISGRAEARVANFCVQVEYIKYQPWDDKLPLMGVVSFFTFWPAVISLESVNLGTSNFGCWLVQSTFDRLPPKWISSGLCELFKFWEISGNISEMVQDRHVVAFGD